MNSLNLNKKKVKLICDQEWTLGSDINAWNVWW